MRVHAGILIRRPIAAVFAYLSAPSHLPCWVTGVATADGPTGDRQGVSATLVLGSATRLGSPRSTWEVTAYEPPRTLALRGLDDGCGLEVFWTLERVPSDATRVWVEADLEAAGFFRPAPTYLQEIGVRQLQDDLAGLRRQLEDEAGEGGR